TDGARRAGRRPGGVRRSRPPAVSPTSLSPARPHHLNVAVTAAGHPNGDGHGTGVGGSVRVSAGPGPRALVRVGAGAGRGSAAGGTPPSTISGLVSRAARTGAGRTPRSGGRGRRGP